MLKELVEKLQKLSKEHVPFNPSRFDDPNAVNTVWTPAKEEEEQTLRHII